MGPHIGGMGPHFGGIGPIFVVGAHLGGMGPSIGGMGPHVSGMRPHIGITGAHVSGRGPILVALGHFDTLKNKLNKKASLRKNLKPMFHFTFFNCILSQRCINIFMYILWSKTSTCKEGVYGGIDLIDFINYKLRK